MQLGTIRYLGTFLEDPLAVPDAVMHTLRKQLSIGIREDAAVYGGGEQRWLHATEISAVYDYVEITEPRAAFRLTRWLYALCWTGNDRPSVLFEWAAAWLVRHKVLLPACTTLERYIAIFAAVRRRDSGGRSLRVSMLNNRWKSRRCLSRSLAAATRRWIVCGPGL